MASSAGFKSNVPSFEPNNFNGWARLFRAYLMRHEGLNETLDESSEEEEEEEDEGMSDAQRKELRKAKKLKKVNQQKVYSYLMEAAAADPTAKSIVTSASMEIGNPKPILKALESRFSVKRALTYQQSLKSFHNMDMTSEETGAQFVDRIKSKVSELCYFKDEAPPTDATTLAILTEGIKNRFPILYNNLVVSSISLADAYELISNYVSTASTESTASVLSVPKVFVAKNDDQAVAHFMAENKKLKKSVRRFQKLQKKRNSTSHNDADIECFKCHKKGHKKFECPLNKKSKTSGDFHGSGAKKKQRLSWANVTEDDDGDANVVFEEIASVTCDTDDLILIDSGANRFVVRDKAKLDKFVEVTAAMNLAGAMTGLPVRGVGSIGCFENVKWCPTARHDLVSISALRDALKCRTILDDADGTPVKFIRNSDNLVLFSGGCKLNGLYYCDFSIVKQLSDLNLSNHDNSYYLANLSTESNLVEANYVDKFLLLHNRSGHLNYSALNECVKNDLLLNTGVKPKDIRDSKNKARPVCDVCARSKGTRTSFKPIHGIRGKLFGDYTSVDIVSYSVPSREGYVYVLTFTDHASKKSKSYPLINRTGDIILFCLRDYIQTELATRDVRLRHYHADGGGELICKLVLAELKSRGATYSWTPPDTPELNAVSERKFRTLFERALAMLL